VADEITHQQLEGNLPDAMRAEEAAQRALAGLLHGPAKVATLFEWKREGLANLLNPQAVPDHLVASGPAPCRPRAAWTRPSSEP